MVGEKSTTSKNRFTRNSAKHEAEGWIYIKDLKTGVKMRKSRTHDKLLENRVWCMLYQLGYPVLNSGRRFDIRIAGSDGKPVTKQIDVFAKDDETVIIFECKSGEEIATKLGGHKVFIFCVAPADLLKISFVNHRDLRDPGGAPAYQRLLKEGRLKKIAAYLDDGNFFPNSILVSFHKNVRFDVSDKSYDKSSQFGSLYLPNTYKSCWIIDGQHRLYGCSLSKNPPHA
jgi:hypothetical protein